MDFKQVEDFVDQHLDLIKVDAKSLAASRERAAQFLVAQAILANHVKSLEEARATLSSLVEARYANAIRITDGKNITEKKTFVAENAEYVEVREQLENLDAECNWTKTHMKIFENAHVLFRQFSKD